MFYDYAYEGTRKTLLILITPDNEQATFEEIYSTTGLLLEEKAYRSEDDLIHWNRLEYDEQNRLIREIGLDTSGHPDGYRMYHYAEGEQTGYDFIDKDGKISCTHRYKMKYDQHRNWTEELLIKDGQPHSKTVRLIEYYNFSALSPESS